MAYASEDEGPRRGIPLGKLAPAEGEAVIEVRELNEALAAADREVRTLGDPRLWLDWLDFLDRARVRGGILVRR